ncbi:WD40 domain containing protein [Pyrrhoderma noxium]|uniref:WD40 domain containing protein n=1 Tax=Pyrrhoderma noxium TaxID=2282107 RepID=A0A286UE34_9AGAM|nr:WD40 domain containing protein [Pyrrhoderma noxium]
MESSKVVYYTIDVLKADTIKTWKRRWRPIFLRLISAKGDRSSLLVELSTGGISQETNATKDKTSPTWNRSFPLLSAKSSDKLSVRIHRNTRTSKSVVIGYGDITLDDLLGGNGDKEVSIPLRPSIKPNNKSLGSLLVCLRTSNPGDCAKLALSNLIVDCGETTTDGLEFKIEDIDIDTVIKDSEVVMKSNMPKIFRDAVPGIDAFSNAVERIVDAHPYLKLAWGITTALYDVVQHQMKFDERVKRLVDDIVMAFYIAKDISNIHRQIDSLSHLATELIDFLIECCIRIRAYSLRSFIGRVLNPGEKSEIEECEETIKKLKVDIDSAFSRQDVAINSRRADSDLLRKLYYVLDPIHLSGHDRPHCLKNTRVSIRKEIDDWAQSTTSPNVFLLVGGAGTGKSTISTTIAEEYRRNDSLGCYLFFLRSKSDPMAVIRTVAYNLAVYNQNIAECIEDALRNKGELISATLDTQFDTFLSIPLHQSQIKSKPILVVLDALDECGFQDTRRTLLQVLEDKLSTLPANFRFLITSRPEEDIIGSLSDLSEIRTARLDNYDGTDDVHLYIGTKLDKMREKGMIDVEDLLEFDDMKRKLGETAGGLFIWASTAIKMIEGARGKHTSKLRELSGGSPLYLGALYSEALRDALVWDDETKRLFSDVLGLIMFWGEQMTDLKIGGILGKKEGISEMLSCLRPFVIYDREKTIKLHHISFYDYLINDSTKNEAWYIDEAESRRRIAERRPAWMDRILRFIENGFRVDLRDASGSNIGNDAIVLGLRDQLSELELPGHVLENLTGRIAAYGAYSDIYIGIISREHIDPKIAFEHSRRKIKVAIKKLRFFPQGEEEYMKNFVRELMIWSKLRHPNVLPLLGYYYEGNCPCMISEWMEYRDAVDYMRKNELSAKELLHMFLGIANGVDYIHGENIAHSDLKTNNILITESGRPLVYDFGSSFSLTLNNETTYHPRRNSRFMAPELFISDEEVSKAGDIWALGMTFYHLISKDIPFSRFIGYQVMHAITVLRQLPEYPPSLLDLGSHMSCIWNVLLLCWAHSVDDRLEISEIIRALEICIRIVSGAESEAKYLSVQLLNLLVDGKESRRSHLKEYNGIGLE